MRHLLVHVHILCTKKCLIRLKSLIFKRVYVQDAANSLTSELAAGQ